MDHTLSRQIGRIVAKAWTDDAFKARLVADPAGTLAAEGVPVPDGMTLAVLEDTDTLRHIVIPAKPDGVLSDAALDDVAAGSWFDGFRNRPLIPIG